MEPRSVVVELDLLQSGLGHLVVSNAVREVGQKWFLNHLAIAL
jgi:hypothetical protein